MSALVDISTASGMISNYALGELPRAGWGHVHSCFSSSLNIQTEGLLLHVGDVESPLSCLGLTLPTQSMRALLSSCEAGTFVRFTDGSFTAYGRKAAYRVRFGDMDVVDCSIPRIGEEEAGRLVPLLREVRPGRDLGLERNEEFDCCSEVLLSRSDDKRLQTCVRWLIGRGRGLTPSGDDLLVGYGTALWMLGMPRPFCDVVVSESSRKTTDVSIAYLKAMVEGYANSDYCALARACVDREVDVCRRLIRRLMNVGSTSGRDGLYGFALGLGAVA